MMVFQNQCTRVITLFTCYITDMTPQMYSKISRRVDIDFTGESITC